MKLDGLSGGPKFSLYVERAARAVLMVDLVESVRLMEADEKHTVSRWLDLVHLIESQTIPNHNGRLIKVLGDGFLADFDTVKEAVTAAFEIQNIAASRNTKEMNDDKHFLLRMGIEIADIYDDKRDIYGHGVNLAARLMTLAGPGEIVVSAAARDQVVPDIDADVEDLGDCYVKHVREPIRAYRLGAVGKKPVIKTGIPRGDLLPTIAVLPFNSYLPQQDKHVLGNVLAEELIQAFSVSQHLNVISRLSTSAFRGHDVDLNMIATHLKAQFVLAGSYRVDGDKISVNVELSEVKTRKVLWSNKFTDLLESIFNDDQALVIRITGAVAKAIIAKQLKRSRCRPLPTLETYSLLMSAITLMHRLSPKNFEQARKILDIIIERVPREASLYAWIANWHVLKVQQGWTENFQRESQLAQDFSKRALDINPDSSLALAIDGFVHTNLLKQLDTAEKRYEKATENNPNNTLAWLLKGTLHAFRGEGSKAVANTERAIVLSPLDPHRYFHDSLMATACNANNEFGKGLEIAMRSLKANRYHSSTLRTIVVSQWNLGLHDEARETMKGLRELEPSLTVKTWLELSPASQFEVGKNWSQALMGAGLPEQ